MLHLYMLWLGTLEVGNSAISLRITRRAPDRVMSIFSVFVHGLFGQTTDFFWLPRHGLIKRDSDPVDFGTWIIVISS